MSGIAFAGSLIVDHINTIERLPERSELSKIITVEKSTGGCVCNTGIDLAKLDKSIKTYGIGLVGNDADGDLIVDALAENGFDVSGIKRRGITSFTDVFAETSTKCRTFYQYPGVCAEFDIDDVDVDGLDCDIFHIGYILLMDALDSYDDEYGTRLARLLSRVQARGIKTSVDIVSESSDRFAKVVTPALKYLDYLTINEIEAEKTTGISLQNPDGSAKSENMPMVLNRLLELGVKRRAIIHCKQGAYGLDADGTYAEEPSKLLPKGYIAGTVGAGDAFCAGTLLAAYRGLGVKDALIYGNASAQVSLRSSSATGSMCGIDEAIEEYNRL